MNDLIIALLANLAHLLGGNLGWAIIVLSLGVRTALLPLTIGLARRARRNQEIMLRLQPELERLKQRYEKNPERLFAEMRRLYREHGCSPFDIPTLLGGFVQLPIFGMLYTSIRSSLSTSSAFLWIRSLAAPDLILTLAIVGLTGISAYFMPAAPGQMRGLLVLIQMAVMFFIVWKLAAGLGLYWASSSLVGVFQTHWLRSRHEHNRTG
ncbi:MAG TPA: YidC/Oxa1 family membrane protein insertase [Verrucomicrobiae bacterium]|nr:YidC/Oxa1 family membrane protein insertase [Verrucomicrobiae bacterium]